MASLNKVILLGNLTRDPELRYTPNGAAVASFGLAVNRRYRQGEEWREEVCFVDIETWGRQAETVGEYLSKGNLAMVEGRLKFRTWETQEGQKRSKHEVVADNVQFMPRGRDDNMGGRSGGSSDYGSGSSGGSPGYGNRASGGTGSPGGPGGFSPGDMPSPSSGMGQMPAPEDDDIPF